VNYIWTVVIRYKGEIISLKAFKKREDALSCLESIAFEATADLPGDEADHFVAGVLATHRLEIGEAITTIIMTPYRE